MIVDGIVSEIQLSYLNYPTGKRLDSTLIPGKSQSSKREDIGQQKYAIEIMSKEVISQGHEISVKDALSLLKKHNIHHLVLTKEAHVVGIVSDRDLLWVDKIHLSEHAMAKQFMAQTILCCHEETPIDFIAKVMVKEQISAIPVIDSKHTLSGIITHHDLLAQLY